MSFPTFNSAEEFFAHLQQLDEENRQRMVADLFSRNLTLRAEIKKFGQDLTTNQRQLVEANAVIERLP
ncbi:hypothetical protein GcM3_110024 [Golovinomyces cichoracearum]|uniref:Uncharacterized protein n=1 Tax=Golovinomyces cichoracearum TaxID=62708 RepID=A0A420I943_9PEZI|nr:hypothetical protein GcM3_110024 [Golovinomyces cichoracearum]